MSKKKILVISILMGLIILGGAAVFYFWPKSGAENNQVKAGFTLNGPIDYAKYEKLGLKKGQIDVLFEKMKKLDESLKQRPNDYDDLIQLGGFEKILKEYDAALKTYEQAILAFPDYGVAYAETADLYIYPLGRFDEAEDYLKKAIERMPYRSDYYRWLADLYVSEFPDKKSEIEPLMLSGVKEAPENATNFYRYLIEFFRQEGNYQKAIDYAKKSLKLNPQEEILKKTLIDLQAQLKNK